jgi:hypothetical protein
MNLDSLALLPNVFGSLALLPNVFPMVQSLLPNEFLRLRYCLMFQSVLYLAAGAVKKRSF